MIRLLETMIPKPKVAAFIDRKDIVEVMGWNYEQFRYQKQFLEPFGLINASGYRMPFKGFVEYIQVKSRYGNARIKEYLTE